MASCAKEMTKIQFIELNWQRFAFDRVDRMPSTWQHFWLNWNNFIELPPAILEAKHKLRQHQIHLSYFLKSFAFKSEMIAYFYFKWKIFILFHVETVNTVAVFFVSLHTKETSWFKIFLWKNLSAPPKSDHLFFTLYLTVLTIDQTSQLSTANCPLVVYGRRNAHCS